MTSQVNFHVPYDRLIDCRMLFGLEDLGFIPPDRIAPHEGAYHIELDAEEVTYLLEQLHLAAECVRSESFVEWRSQRANQQQLELRVPTLRPVS
jgi:hypothetical protein